MDSLSSTSPTSTIATFANGCFWCTEAVFKRLKGVTKVVSGYTGGHADNPSYEQVSSGETGHAEAIQVTFDPTVVPYETLLRVFFATHDPTTKNRQGNDVGTQYRSAIFFHDDEQKQIAEKYIATMEKEGKHQGHIVTEISPFTKFYEAENYHKDYYDRNSSALYCQVIIDPKIQKLLARFSDEVKDEYK